MSALFSGVLLMGYAVAGLFFLRFWRETRDRLFGIFAAAFFLLAVQRLSLTLLPSEDPVFLYLIRLAAYLLILWAIVDKNRAPG